MKRMLITASVPGHVRAFHLPLIREMTSRGWQVEVAANAALTDELLHSNHVVPWSRRPFARGNLVALRQLRHLLGEQSFDLVYCHTPIAAAITRLAAWLSRSKGTRVVYMAHGFHFFKGAPMRNWLLYFPAELILSNLTDQLLTINQEDYDRASRWFRTSVRQTSGVGMATDDFVAGAGTHTSQLRADLGVADTSKILMFVGEISRGKNQELLIHAVSKVRGRGGEVDLVLVGGGPAQESLGELAEQLGLQKHVHFLGFRDDVASLLDQADLVTAPSMREGLPHNVLEAMSLSKPVLASPIRGHVDLIEHGRTGFLAQSFDPNEWALAIESILHRPGLMEKVGEGAAKRAKDFDLAKAVSALAMLLEG